ncbi:MAG TPA: tRNA (guanosine(46)-N7)-methyltransferase TrmB [Bacteroidales bacterium]|nr:tRNA (guanosine(46)-N7)-methyltransferase TrmB [Bacteroidales bacterium]
MSKNKLARFEESRNFPNLIQAGYFELIQKYHLRGNWAQNHFHNSNPIVLELGCGKGEYTLALARKNADANYIGIDNKGARLWRGCRTAIEDGVSNVAFFRTRIEQIEQIFAPNEISGIWITFPDPHPQNSKSEKRLTSPRFLEHYRNILVPESIIHLKTDELQLFEYTLNVIKEKRMQLLFHSFDLYNEATFEEASLVQTFYEKSFLAQGKKIKYLRFRIS